MMLPPSCLAFLWRFSSSGFFLAERPFRLCRYRTRFTVDFDSFVPVFLQHLHKDLCCCSGIALHHQSTFISRRQNASFLSGMMAAWSHGVHTCVLLFVQMNVEPSGIWKLLPRMNQNCGGVQFLVLADFFSFSHDVNQRETGFEDRP